MSPPRQITGSPSSTDPGKNPISPRESVVISKLKRSRPVQSACSFDSSIFLAWIKVRGRASPRNWSRKRLVTVPSPRTVHSKREKSRSVNQGGRNERPRKGSRTQTRDTWIKLRSVFGSRAWTELGFPLRSVAERGFASFGFRFQPSSGTIARLGHNRMGWKIKNDRREIVSKCRFGCKI